MQDLTTRLRHRLAAIDNKPLYTSPYYGFRNPQELQAHLAEGALLGITAQGERALAIPRGEYVVWTTGAGNTMLVPTGLGKVPRDIFHTHTEEFEVLTPDLLKHWNKLERILVEGPEENLPETTDDDDDDAFKSRIEMDTVDRTPIARAISDKGLTLTQVADAIGVDTPAISRLLRSPKDRQGDPGGRNPSIELASRLCKFLSIPVEAAFPDLFGPSSTSIGKMDTRKGNRGSGMGNAAAGSRHKGKANSLWTQGNS